MLKSLALPIFMSVRAHRGVLIYSSWASAITLECGVLRRPGLWHELVEHSLYERYMESSMREGAPSVAMHSQSGAPLSTEPSFLSKNSARVHTASVQQALAINPSGAERCTPGWSQTPTKRSSTGQLLHNRTAALSRLSAGAHSHFFAIVFMLCLMAILSGCTREQPKAERPPFPVTVGDVIQKDVPVYVETIGNVYSLQSVDVRPQVGGILQEAYVKQGQYVKKGDPLYRIDPRPYEAALNRAMATLEKDKATLRFSEIKAERYKELVKQDYVSKLNYDQYQADVEVAKAQVQSDEADVAMASLNLEWTTPTSPLDGKISQYDIDPGNLVVANDPTALTNIRQLDPADIRFGIVQRDFLEVQKALREGTLRFLVLLPQQMDKPREGEIYFIDNHVDTTTGTILLKGTVPNPDELLWPGEFVRVRLQLRLEPQAILVPEEAVQVGQDGPFVFIYDPSTSTVSYRPVTRGATSDHLVILASGVAVGEKVVLKGQINLRSGAKVALVDQRAGTKEGNL